MNLRKRNGRFLIILVSLIPIRAITPLAIVAQGGSESTKKAAIEIVRQFNEKSGRVGTEFRPLSATLVSYPYLPGIAFCRVSEGGTIGQGEAGQLQSRIVSHPRTWLVAFSEDRAFKLAGFGDETDFYALMQRVNKEVPDSRRAMLQIEAYFDLVYGRRPIFIGSERELELQVRSSFDWAGKDAKNESDKWLAGVPSFVRKRISPPRSYPMAEGFVVEVYALSDSPYRLTFWRYSFRVEKDGRVILIESTNLNVPDF